MCSVAGPPGTWLEPLRYTILVPEEEEVRGLCRVCDQGNQLCVVSAMVYGKCSLRWSATVSVVQECMW